MLKKLKLDLSTGKADKKSLWYLGIVVVIAILVGVGSFYFLFQVPEIEVKPVEEKPAEKSMEEIIKDLTVPEGQAEPEPLSEEVIEDLTVPESKKESSPLSEDVIKDLTVPE